MAPVVVASDAWGSAPAASARTTLGPSLLERHARRLSAASARALARHRTAILPAGRRGSCDRDSVRFGPACHGLAISFGMASPTSYVMSISPNGERDDNQSHRTCPRRYRRN